MSVKFLPESRYSDPAFGFCQMQQSWVASASEVAVAAKAISDAYSKATGQEGSQAARAGPGCWLGLFACRGDSMGDGSLAVSRIGVLYQARRFSERQEMQVMLGRAGSFYRDMDQAVGDIATYPSIDGEGMVMGLIGIGVGGDPLLCSISDGRGKRIAKMPPGTALVQAELGIIGRAAALRLPDGH